ncbi:MAG: acetyl/propionyl/methylcrotonyl-CoA carboxylase subunit alpha [Polaromonas sp.]|jgi:geranyl-CoA carboxylase alpha subunit|uniref:acetyl/propionyl/methylcrotonyl-CoA carboxylase subunit alpha n=1 Tax=Polaromonas sp. TaxID=1869339 RepID=UPI002488CFEB|nr:acetyl/propionyl/methylcrotonyl-CoA carboxylase subunit alpha [Polaromonas sp.]MDI1236487.1 acetyl/propionyl/methylcrotonyl-CoA carboxylase subunit alpha [Polaromonas sp.]
MNFTKILIANRGEIACRVIRTAKALGYRTVAVYSEADAQALHVAMADEAVCIGPAPVRESYLNVAALLAAARSTGADAVHPGYGFLSENDGFAQACLDAGLVFIGPDPQAILQMGNKAGAKRLMLAAGVPCVPGYQGTDQSDATLLGKAGEIGFPIMVKAAAGGGGRGMRLVEHPQDLAVALVSARSEAGNAFGSEELILERAVIEPRHVEIQVFGDQHGYIIHLGERDCSIQRRHQKVFEEAPSPAVTPELRAQMGAAAVAAARTVNYVGAGTVEFLLDREGRFYFLEMNTRLQVEHPVTECITGLDLVAWQIAVARGEPLPLTQEQVQLNGHAIEVRLYAEDPYAGFLPQSGDVALWSPPTGEGVRVDHGLASGQTVSPHYDPMIAKIIAHGATRDEARRRLIGALQRTRLLGLPHNRAFLEAVASHPAFAAGETTTAFIAKHFDSAALVRPQPDSLALALASTLWFEACATPVSAAPWRSSGPARWPMLIGEGEHRHAVHITATGAHSYTLEVGTALHHITLSGREGECLRLIADGVQQHAAAVFAGGVLHLELGDLSASFEDLTYAPPAAAAGSAESRVLAPMNGRVLAVDVRNGDTVTKGQRLAVLEAMKMEHQLLARRDGVVDQVAVRAGDQVATRALLVSLVEQPD